MRRRHLQKQPVNCCRMNSQKESNRLADNTQDEGQVENEYSATSIHKELADYRGLHREAMGENLDKMNMMELTELEAKLESGRKRLRYLAKVGRKKVLKGILAQVKSLYMEAIQNSGLRSSESLKSLEELTRIIEVCLNEDSDVASAS